MAATPGFNATIEVSADDSTYNDIGIANTVSGNIQAAMLEITSFGDGAMKRIAGLFDAPITVSGHYDDSDTGQTAIKTALLARTPLYVRYLADGTNGFKVLALVENHEFASGVGDTNTFSVSFQSIAAPTLI